MSRLTLAVAQINCWVGDIEGNVDRMIDAAQRARDELHADLVVFPELCLIGYPPDDLLLRSALPAAVEAAVQRLQRAASGIALVVGLPEFAAEGVYNAALVLRDGAIVARYRKQCLPNYGVFDEKRHFQPGGDETLIFEQGGVRLGLCICEDIWQSAPAEAARAAGAELLLNINASPFDQGKQAQRRLRLAQRARETGLPIVYVNCVGGQDDLVFDGDSCAVDGQGYEVFRAADFVADVYAVHFENGCLSGQVTPRLSPEAAVYQALVCAVRDYVDRNGFPGALVGLSGGIDSALVAAVAADALGPDRVWAVSLPSRYTADMSNDDARIEAKNLGIRYTLLPIEGACAAVDETLAETFADRSVDLTEENIQARLRGLLLMALSNKFDNVVLATGNKSEMAVGYATLYGDMCGGFAPIKDVYKTWVYRLARYRNSVSPVIPERVLTRPPSAELRPDQADADSLPAYEILDPILEAYIEDCLSIAEIVAMGYDEAAVRQATTLVRRAEYKRRQAPPGPKITRRAFGRERRYPLTAVYGGL